MSVPKTPGRATTPAPLDLAKLTKDLSEQTKITGDLITRYFDSKDPAEQTRLAASIKNAVSGLNNLEKQVKETAGKTAGKTKEFFTAQLKILATQKDMAESIRDERTGDFSPLQDSSLPAHAVGDTEIASLASKIKKESQELYRLVDKYFDSKSPLEQSRLFDEMNLSVVRLMEIEESVDEMTRSGVQLGSSHFKNVAAVKDFLQKELVHSEVLREIVGSISTNQNAPTARQKDAAFESQLRQVFTIHPVASDNDCCFASCGSGASPPRTASVLRAQVADYIRDNIADYREGIKMQFLDDITSPGGLVGYPDDVRTRLEALKGDLKAARAFVNSEEEDAGWKYYLKTLRRDQEMFGGAIELQVMSTLLETRIDVYSSDKPARNGQPLEPSPSYGELRPGQTPISIVFWPSRLHFDRLERSAQTS